jgi:hypothetical protein
MRITVHSGQIAVFSAVAAGLVGSAAPQPAAADVQSSSPAGFVVRIEMPVAAAPTDVYTKLFEIGRWWSEAHTYTGKASNLTLKNEPGGCFCEALPSGGFVRHAAVEYSDKGKVVRLSGGLGPLQELGAQGMLSFNLLPADKAGTRLVVSYVVSGYPANEKGFAALAAPVNGVLKEQIERLKRYVETGKPAP